MSKSSIVIDPQTGMPYPPWATPQEHKFIQDPHTEDQVAALKRGYSDYVREDLFIERNADEIFSGITDGPVTQAERDRWAEEERKKQEFLDNKRRHNAQYQKDMSGLNVIIALVVSVVVLGVAYLALFVGPLPVTP